MQVSQQDEIKVGVQPAKPAPKIFTESKKVHHNLVSLSARIEHISNYFIILGIWISLQIHVLSCKCVLSCTFEESLSFPNVAWLRTIQGWVHYWFFVLQSPLRHWIYSIIAFILDLWFAHSLLIGRSLHKILFDIEKIWRKIKAAKSLHISKVGLLNCLLFPKLSRSLLIN